MATNKFLPMATSTGANVVSDDEWSDLSARSTGFVSGTAYSAQVNKALRQASVITAMIGQFIVDKAVADANDGQSVATIEANFIEALNSVINDALGGATTMYLPITGGTLTGPLTLSGAPTVDLNAATKKYVDDLISAIPGVDLSPVYAQIVYAAPPGLIADFGKSTAPTGWLQCNGAAISRTTYADLYTAIGTTWGSGDGSTTFNVPDFRGIFRRGWDNGRGYDSSRTFASYQADAFSSHTHSVTLITRAGGDTSGSDGFDYAAGSSGSKTVTSNATGSTETRPKNYSVLPVIKY